MSTSSFRNVDALQGKSEFSLKVTVYVSEYLSEKYTLREKCKRLGEMGVLFCMPGDIFCCQVCFIM